MLTSATGTALRTAAGAVIAIAGTTGRAATIMTATARGTAGRTTGTALTVTHCFHHLSVMDLGHSAIGAEVEDRFQADNQLVPLVNTSFLKDLDCHYLNITQPNRQVDYITNRGITPINPKYRPIDAFSDLVVIHCRPLTL